MEFSAIGLCGPKYQTSVDSIYSVKPGIHDFAILLMTGMVGLHYGLGMNVTSLSFCGYFSSFFLFLEQLVIWTYVRAEPM